jgi:hypothetical protein
VEPAKKGTQKSGKRSAATGKKPKGFTDEERDAMRGVALRPRALAARSRKAAP